MDNTFFNTCGRKLGIQLPKISRKAEELCRLLDVKGFGRSLSTSAKVVICLDMAATLEHSPIEKKEAIKLSGLNKSQYVASYQTAEKFLNLSSGVSIQDLCITHSVSEAKELAIKLLKRYEIDSRKQGGTDYSSPIFSVTAVVAACNIMKLKVDKRKMYEASNSKRAIYDSTLQSMSKIAEELYDKKPVNNNTKTSKKTLLEAIEDNLEQNKKLKPDKSDDCSDKEETADEDDYEEWKRKILEAAQK